MMTLLPSLSPHSRYWLSIHSEPGAGDTQVKGTAPALQESAVLMRRQAMQPSHHHQRGKISPCKASEWALHSQHSNSINCCY